MNNSTYPLTYYRQRRMAVFVIMVSCLAMLLLINEIFELGLNSPFADLPHWVIYLLLAIFGIFIFLLSRLVIYHRPIISFYAKYLKVYHVFDKNKDQIFYYQDLQKPTFVFGRFPLMIITSKDTTPNTTKQLPIYALTLNSQSINTRQFADIVNQIFDDFYQERDNKIEIRDIKKGFLDWY